MTSRLPRGLKKRLEASLTSLTPREAGRLFLIYIHEAAKKNRDARGYPPIKDLWDTWESRVRKARSTPRELQEVRAYNGFVLLTNIIAEVDNTTETEIFRLMVVSLAVGGQIRNTLLADHVSEIARLTMIFFDDMPKPASHEEYELLTAFAESDQLLSLNEAAYDLAYDLIEDMGGVDIEVNRRKAALTAEELAEETEDDVSEELSYLVSEELSDLVSEPLYDLLESWVEGGDWGGLAVSLPNCYSPVPIVGGSIPAWAALRAIWPRWLGDHDFFTREDPMIDAEALDGLTAVYDVGGDLEADRLVAVVADFVADCRSRPWGADLAADIDPAGLARFLIERENPIISHKAPNLGKIDWEVFRSREGDESSNWEPTTAATILDLKGRAADLGVSPDFFDRDYFREMYYLSSQAKGERSHRARIMRLQKGLRASHRSFTYARRAEKGDLFPPGDILGVKFTTPLEENVRLLGKLFGEVSTLKQGLDLISEEYFGGLSAWSPWNQEKLDLLDQASHEAEDLLNTWIAQLEKENWGIDTTSLRLIKDEADEAKAREWVADVVKTAKRITRFDEELFDLGDDPGRGAR